MQHNDALSEEVKFWKNKYQSQTNKKRAGAARLSQDKEMFEMQQELRASQAAKSILENEISQLKAAGVLSPKSAEPTADMTLIQELGARVLSLMPEGPKVFWLS